LYSVSVGLERSCWLARNWYGKIKGQDIKCLWILPLVYSFGTFGAFLVIYPFDVSEKMTSPRDIYDRASVAKKNGVNANTVKATRRSCKICHRRESLLICWSKIPSPLD
jgi:hypothetical protein